MSHEGIDPVNARWERQPSVNREAVERCAPALANPEPGEHAPIRDLIVGTFGATGAARDPIAAQLVEAARQLAAVWSELCDKANRQAQALPEARAADRTSGTSCASGAAPVLAAHVLGPFRVLVNDAVIEDWPNCRSKLIFKYLLLNRQHPVAKEALMELLWPEAEPAAARNSLNVAMHRLRRALGRDNRAFPFVLFSGGHYRLNPKLEVSTDADAFLARAARGGELERCQQIDGALQEYAACAALYQGELLAEDRYDEWLLPLRQQLRDRYLHVLDRLSRIRFDQRDYPSCTASCAKILAVDACNEGAHRMLMRCYASLGQPQLAQRQYQACIQVLNRELAIPASAETTGLYRQIVRRHVV